MLALCCRCKIDRSACPIVDSDLLNNFNPAGEVQIAKLSVGESHGMFDIDCLRNVWGIGDLTTF